MKRIEIKISRKRIRFLGYDPFALFILTGLFALITMTSACTKHYAAAVATGQSVSVPKAATTAKVETMTLADSLIGTWKIRKTEIEQALDKMTTYGSQTQRDAMVEKQKQYQAAFLGLTTTFKSDSTFLSIFGGQSDVGTWQISRKREIETMSKVTGNASSFQVVSLDGSILVVKYDVPDMVLLLTFAKQ